MRRFQIIERIRDHKKAWDVVIIGGGATGAGCALDAASRGFETLLLERADFGKGTSSRSTKLIHGGVRYLAQGNISLVRESLRERGLLLENAPDFVKKLEFTVPCYSRFEKFYYGIGLKLYDLLSGKLRFGRSRFLSKDETLERLPNIRSDGLTGGISYFDGQFDDANFLIEILKSASSNGASCLNYATVFDVSKDSNGNVNGVSFTDEESGELFEVRSQVVINAAGAFCDSIRRFSNSSAKNIIAPSQGIHLVFDSSLLSSKTALMIPKTTDGRVLFAIPFHNKTLVGTTDTAIETVSEEPAALESEIDFILQNANSYFEKELSRADVLSVFAGIRPLVKNSAQSSTKQLSRDHTIEIDNSNLLTITGGKWTTYRNMAEDAVDHAIEISNLPAKACRTKKLKIKDSRIESSGEWIVPDIHITKAEIVDAIENGFARTVEDILSRRSRLLFLDAERAVTAAKPVALIMAEILKRDAIWVEDQTSSFTDLAQSYKI